MDLRFYNFGFELLHIESDIVSSNWTVYNNGVGSFEIHMPSKSDIVTLLRNNFDLESSKMLVVVQGDLQGIITGILIKNDCAIYGKTCNWLLTKRLIAPFRSSTLQTGQDGESISRWCVQNAFSDVDNFALGTAVGFDAVYSGENAFWRSVYHESSEVVKDLMNAAGGGHFLYFDTENNRWVFNTTKNRLSNVIISTALMNAHDMEYSYDISEYVGDGWYEAEVYDDDGLLTAFEWKHIVKQEKSGIYKWTGVIHATTDAEAKAGLLRRSINGHTVTEVRNLKYKRDFNLGDIVRIQFERCGFTSTVQALIDGIILGFENNNITQKIIFKEVTE